MFEAALFEAAAGTGSFTSRCLELPRARRIQRFLAARWFFRPPKARPKNFAPLPFRFSCSNSSPKESQSKLTHRDALWVLSSNTMLWEKVPGQPRTGDSASTRRHRSSAISSLLPVLLRASHRLHPVTPLFAHSDPKLFTTDEDMSPSGARFGMLRERLCAWGDAWIPRGTPWPLACQ